jgi:alpha-N-acetylglucosamine transferase
VIHLDSDSTVLQNMDELFFLPSAQVAMPRAFWELPHTKQLSSQLIVLEPSHREYYALMEEAKPAMYGQVDTSNNDTHQYDMDILDKRYGNSALVLPHRQYSLITGEFRNKDHRRYLGNEYETWDPDRALAEAKLIHFSDWPLPKPWVMWPRELLTEVMPKCDYKPGTAEESGCRDRAVWKKLYDDFRRRRKVRLFFASSHPWFLLTSSYQAYLPTPQLPCA